jgi:hypothetical protein
MKGTNMGNEENTQLLTVYICEYEKLKQEQIARIGFRDNLIYATLIALTTVVSVVADDSARIPVLLVLPLVCITLGWTYLVNDEKISAIGRYIRITFSDKVRELIKSKDPLLFGWEMVHRSDNRRGSRKIIQFFVDEFVFVLPGVIAVLIFWLNSNNLLLLRWIAGVELLFLLILGAQIFSYADLKKGK